MIAFHITHVNEYLQSLLLLGTITYTIVRTVNEIQKYNENKDGKGKSSNNEGS